jgi:hypothetical protein
MNAKTGVSFGTRLLTAGAMLAMFALAPQARADVVRIHFSNPVLGSGYADLTLGSSAGPDDTVDPNHPPKAITGATGKFNGIAITDVRPLDPTAPPPGETLIPGSYSLFSIPGVGDHDGVTYDNLFYGNGSPQICWIVDDAHPDGYFAFPFYGGMFDLLGVMFKLENGDFLDLWSFGVVDPAKGVFPPSVSGLTYGMKLIQPDGNGGYQAVMAPPFSVASVPEPNFLWLFGAGVLGLLVWRRSAEARVKAAQAY